MRTRNKEQQFRILFIDHNNTVMSETKHSFYTIKEARHFAKRLFDNTKNVSLKEIIAIK